MKQPNPGSTPVARADEFFIGWLPLPSSYARVAYVAVTALVILMVTAAVILARQQQSPGVGTWETNKEVELTGVAVAEPYALLRVAGRGPGQLDRTVLLVEEGKFGAQERVRPFSNQQVTIRGITLQRDGRAMLELSASAGAIQLASDSSSVSPFADSLANKPPQPVVLTGEVIDPKCYLGAMKPGGGKTHKACAALCIRGGIPPMLVTHSNDGKDTYYLLLTQDGGSANELALPYLGDRVQVTAQQEMWGDLPALHLGRTAIRRF